MVTDHWFQTEENFIICAILPVMRAVIKYDAQRAGITITAVIKGAVFVATGKDEKNIKIINNITMTSEKKMNTFFIVSTTPQ